MKTLTKEEWEEFIRNWEPPEPQIATGRMGKELFHKLMQEELERCKDTNYFIDKYFINENKEANREEA